MLMDRPTLGELMGLLFAAALVALVLLTSLCGCSVRGQLPRIEAARLSELGRAAAEPAPRVIRCRVTAYCPCARCCGVMTGRTANGGNAWRPGVAADPRAIPYGTRVRIEGYGLAQVDDTGAAMRRAWRKRGEIRFDVRMLYHWQASEWGVRWLDVMVYGG